MATLRELKGRIGSVASSEKITGAMKMISSAKMHKAEGALRRLVPFRSQVETIIGNLLSSDAQFVSPLTEPRAEVRRVAVIVWGSDDGLCGAYNVNINKQLLANLQQLRNDVGADVQIDIMGIGRKMSKAVAKIDMPGMAAAQPLTEVDSKSEGRCVDQFMQAVQTSYQDGTYDAVWLMYMRFYSAGRQRPEFRKLLPLEQSTFGANTDDAAVRPYLFEPDAATIFNTVIPMYLMAVMQDAFCENRASEQAARVMAMQSANDNAKSLLEQLRLEYNKLRQQSITSELLDIVGGQVRD